jgi:hypothetical protein
MAALVLNCPTTGLMVSTGLAINRADFEFCRRTLVGRAPCPHCGEDHFWTKNDAWIAEDDGLAAQRSGGYEHPPVVYADRDLITEPPRLALPSVSLTSTQG